MLTIVWMCGNGLSIIVHDCFHEPIFTEEFDEDSMTGRKHIDHLIGIVGYIEIRLRHIGGFQDLNSGQPIHTEMRHAMVLVGISDQIVVVVFPFQGVRVQLIKIAVMLENSLFLLCVLIILELDLPVFQDGILDTIDDVIDNAEFSIMLLFIKKPPAFNNF